MVCFLTSLREVAPELHAPGLDVLMVAVDTLGEAPVALEHLEFHSDFSDWRVLNIREVREAATLGGVLLGAEQALARLRLALYMVAAARNAVQSAAGNLRRHASRPVRLISRNAVQISEEGASDAQLQEIDNHLVVVRAATAQPAQGAGELLAEMDTAMVFLRRANRRLEEGLERLDAVAARFNDIRRQASASHDHALTRASPAIMAIPAPFAASLRGLLRVIRDTNAGDHVGLLQLLAGRRRDIRARTARRFEFDVKRFSGPLEVRSRRDLAEVSAMARPHDDESGVPRRRVVIVIRGIDSLVEANAIRHEIDAGVTESGWVVYGLGSLSTAQALHSRIEQLAAVLGRLRQQHVVDDDSVVYRPEFFTQAEQHATEILRILGADSTVAIPEVLLLAQEVRALALASRAPPDSKNPLRTAAHRAYTELRWIRDGSILFVAGA